jgi:hypothetical protein
MNSTRLTGFPLARKGLDSFFLRRLALDIFAQTWALEATFAFTFRVSIITHRFDPDGDPDGDPDEIQGRTERVIAPSPPSSWSRTSSAMAVAVAVAVVQRSLKCQLHRGIVEVYDDTFRAPWASASALAHRPDRWSPTRANSRFSSAIPVLIFD